LYWALLCPHPTCGIIKASLTNPIDRIFWELFAHHLWRSYELFCTFLTHL
jgi:hypothetical protein